MEESYRKMWLTEVKHGHEQCSRIIELEELCRDLWRLLIGEEKIFPGEPETAIEWFDRMEQLGLLEGGDNE